MCKGKEYLEVNGAIFSLTGEVHLRTLFLICRREPVQSWQHFRGNY